MTERPENPTPFSTTLRGRVGDESPCVSVNEKKRLTGPENALTGAPPYVSLFVLVGKPQHIVAVGG
jgi:hypothetical protein